MSARSRIIQKCQAYVSSAFNGNWSAAFHKFADADEVLRIGGLIDFLDRADIGEVYAEPIMGVIDKDGDDGITYLEFQDALGGK